MRTIHPNRRTNELSRHYKIFTAGTKSRFHYINTHWFRLLVKGILSITGLIKLGRKNALKLVVNRVKFTINNLPEAFAGYKILFLSDLHIEALPELLDIIKDRVKNLDYDICLLGGDYRYRASGSNNLMLDKMPELLKFLANKTPVYAVLGNHDEFMVIDFFERCGIKMLVNEHVNITKGNDTLTIVGLDDCHYFNADDFDAAERGIEPDSTKILLSHSPELFDEAEKRGYSLYFAGHTHGGQICLPGGIPMLANANVPRKMISQKWDFGNLQGYTSRGAGSGIVPVRFFCPPEVVVVELE